MLMPRWAGDDIAGRIMESESGWVVIDSPVPPDWDDGDESYWPLETDAYGTFGISAKALGEIKTKNPDTFLTQYQCRPPGAAGGMFQWWSFRQEPLPDEIRAVYQSWDTAYSIQKRSSFQAMTEWLHLKNGRVYMSQAFRKKTEFPLLVEIVKGLCAESASKWGMAPRLLVENRASGPALVQVIRATTAISIEAVNIQNLDLGIRAADVSRHFQSERVQLPQEHHQWKEDYMKQMREFPHNRGRDDDWVASTVLLLKYLYGSYTGPLPKVTVRWGRW